MSMLRENPRSRHRCAEDMAEHRLHHIRTHQPNFKSEISPSPSIAVPSSAKVVAPVQAKTPPINQIASAIPGDGTFVSIEPGDVKTPLPMTMLTTIPKASAAPRLRVNVPRLLRDAFSSRGEARRGCWTAMSSGWSDDILDPGDVYAGVLKVLKQPEGEGDGL